MKTARNRTATNVAQTQVHTTNGDGFPQQLLAAMLAFRQGDFAVRLPVDLTGIDGKIADAFNDIVSVSQRRARETGRVSQTVGKEGRLKQRMTVVGVTGGWADEVAAINMLIDDLVWPTTEVTRAIGAVAKGDLGQSMALEVEGRPLEGEFLRSSQLVNKMIQQLSVFTSEVTRVAREVGTEGKLGGQAQVKDVSGVWKDLTESVNQMAGNLTAQVRNIADVTIAVANGDLSKKITVDVRGEILQLKEAINTMVDQLRSFAAEVTRVAREVGTDGKLGGQAIVPGVAGTWKDLTDNVNQMAGNLTAQVRNIAEVTIAVANGDLSKKITVDVRGEILQLKEAINAMVERDGRGKLSHELRTPLNSILILGQQLSDNPEGNLTLRQVEYARNIHSAGADLFTLINDILDLSKIESGTVTVEAEEIAFASLRDSVERAFHHVAESKNLTFRVEIHSALPRSFTSDPKRLQQILKNLLSNAFKFTSQGEVWMRVAPVTSGWSGDHPILGMAPSVFAIEVRDTGIGIATDKQRLIFEAFQQADAGTSRKYGGTGLGLAISRELASLLGGEIKLVSTPELGSTFTLYLPLSYTGPTRAVTAPVTEGGRDRTALTPAMPVLAVAKTEEVVTDDRDEIEEGQMVLLIVDDDPHYARVLLGLARDRGFKGIVANRGQAGLALARQYRPTAITLDVFLPDMLGWTVLNNLKLDPSTRHIPVQMLSIEEERQHGLSHGAFSYLVKPTTTDDLERALDRIKTYVTPHKKRLLVVEDNDIERRSVVELLMHDDIDITAVASGGDALRALEEGAYDCCVIDLRLPDISGFELLDRIQNDPAIRDLPIVVCTGKELSEREEQRLKVAAKSVVLKDVQSPERLFDETALFLHRVIADLPPAKQQLLERLHGSNDVLRKRKVLVVDDDARNIFALTTVLENHEMEVVSATNGRQAIELIEQTPDLSVVLMDIMMPEMDGYETMRQIRRDPKLRTLPILALTAKAMKGDREKCLEAGASDYVAKPVNTEQLLSLLRVWLYR